MSATMPAATSETTPAAPPATKRAAPRPHRGDAATAYLFLAPFLLVYATFLVYPLFKGFWISLHDWELVGTYRQYIGFLNYVDLWYDPLFWKVVRNTLLFVAITVPAMTLLSLGLALAVHRPGRVGGVLRGVFFASSVFSVTVVTLIWQMVLNGDRGLSAHLLRGLGLQSINFVNDPSWAMPSLVAATLWWGVGLPMALFLASLGQVPRELYEAAELDAASRFTVLRRITLPALKRTTVLVLVIQIIAQFQLFGQAQLLTGGGPANRTRSIVQYIYDTGFRDWQIGYASAMAMVLFALMLGFSMLQLWLGRKED